MKKLPKFSERLTELMFEDNNITTDKLGEKLGLRGSSIRIWRSGRSNPSLQYAILLAEYFNCSLDYLLGRIDNDITFTPQELLPFHISLTTILKEKNLSWYKVVGDTNISKTSMQAWRKGSVPLLPILIELADYLDVSIDYLIGRER